MSRLSLLLILILGISLVVADYEEESEEEEEEEDQEDEGDQGNTSSDESREHDHDLTFIKHICANGLKSIELTQMCCHNHLHLDNASQYCNQNEDTSDIDFSTKKGSIQGITRLIECFFRRKKYIRSQNRINMKQVQADAAKLGDPAETEFMLNMYKTCDEEGARVLQMYNQYPQPIEESLTTPHQSYVQVVYICLNNYFKEKECPYFRWFSENNADHMKCTRYAKECRKLMG